jgi:hypothetical protein
VCRDAGLSSCSATSTALAGPVMPATTSIEAAGGTRREHTSEAVIDRMLDKYDRKGRSTGAGFYECDSEGRRAGLWPSLRDAFKSGSTEVPFEDLKARMLFAEALETVKCFDEGVLTSVADANLRHRLPRVDRCRHPIHQPAREWLAGLHGPGARARAPAPGTSAGPRSTRWWCPGQRSGSPRARMVTTGN